MNRFVAELRMADSVHLEAQPPGDLYDGCEVFYRGYVANAHALIVSLFGPKPSSSDEERL